MLPIVLDNLDAYGLSEISLIILSAGSINVKKNIIKRQLFDISYEVLKKSLTSFEYQQNPELKQCFYSCMKSLKPFIYKQEQKE